MGWKTRSLQASMYVDQKSLAWLPNRSARLRYSTLRSVRPYLGESLDMPAVRYAASPPATSSFRCFELPTRRLSPSILI
jgi:hypothetical protein